MTLSRFPHVCDDFSWKLSKSFPLPRNPQLEQFTVPEEIAKSILSVGLSFSDLTAFLKHFSRPLTFQRL